MKAAKELNVPFGLLDQITGEWIGHASDLCFDQFKARLHEVFGWIRDLVSLFYASLSVLSLARGNDRNKRSRS